MIGFIFANESGAQIFSQKVISKKKLRVRFPPFISPTITHKTCSKIHPQEEEEESWQRRKDRDIYDL